MFFTSFRAPSFCCSLANPGPTDESKFSVTVDPVKILVCFAIVECFIPDRDLIPGDLQYDNIIKGIDNSRKLLIVLTPTYLSLPEKTTGKKGFIPGRDLIPGELQYDNIIKGIDNSRKLLIVLTPTYVKDYNQNYIFNLLLLQSNKMKKTIIPIILKSCSIPDKLKIFTPICFTKKSDWDQLRMSLTANTSSDSDLEERMSSLNISESEED
ncbi:IL1RAPL [Acanthosepion pharaonis]|uniref:IL1RAPL n=1 Tax=Acanthosepion pharaonis TaxID=158019 RepID=A0A812CH77_ACAPH|nr:IL1RAPL [Sepia pharaonis]